VATAAILGQNTLFFLLQMLSVNKTLTTEVFSSLGIYSMNQNQGQRESPFFHLPFWQDKQETANASVPSDMNK